MPRLSNKAIYTALFVSAMALSACSSTQEPVPVIAAAVVETPAEAVAEKQVTPEPPPQAVTVPAATAEQPRVSTQKTVKKAHKVVAKPAPTPAPVPVATPAPVVEYKTPSMVTPEPAPIAAVVPPAKEIAEPGFLDRYWLWLLGLAILVAVIIVWMWKNRE